MNAWEWASVAFVIFALCVVFYALITRGAASDEMDDEQKIADDEWRAAVKEWTKPDPEDTRAPHDVYGDDR